jgi:hypothetical protein
MPVHCERRGGKWRIVDPSGKVTKNKKGTAVDGGGHASKDACNKQAQAINTSLSKRTSTMFAGVLTEEEES